MKVKHRTIKMVDRDKNNKLVFNGLKQIGIDYILTEQLNCDCGCNVIVEKCILRPCDCFSIIAYCDTCNTQYDIEFKL